MTEPTKMTVSDPLHFRNTHRFFEWLLLFTVMILFRFTPDVSAQNRSAMNITEPQVITSGTRSIENKSITIDSSLRGTPVFTVKNGAELILKNCILHPTGPHGAAVFAAEAGASLIFDNTEISGGNTNAPIIESHGSLQFADGSVFRDNTGEGTELINAAEGKLVIHNSSFSGNHTNSKAIITAGDLTLIDKWTTIEELDPQIFIEISDSSFESNSTLGGKDYVNGLFLIAFADLRIDNSTFKENKASGEYADAGVLFAMGSIVRIKDAEFERNSAQDWGGALVIGGSDLEISGCRFIENHAGSGGGLTITDGKAVLNDSLFEKNHAVHFGGGCQAESSFKSNSLDLTINNCDFLRNTTDTRGSALGIGSMSRFYEPVDFIKVRINSGTFMENQAPGVGSAIWNGYESTLTMKNVAVTENEGVGIGFTDFGIASIKPRNGLVIYDNKFEQSPEGIGDLVYCEGVIYSDNMFNGGSHHFQKLDFPDLEDYTLVKSSPTRRDLTGAKVLVQGNKCLKTGRGYCSAIMNNGTLIIGEDDERFSFTKIWEPDAEAPAEIPSPEALIRSIELTANGKLYEPGDPIPDESREDGDGSEHRVYFDSADPSVRYRIDMDQNKWKVFFEGLPAEIDGVPAVYSYTEKLPNYRPVVEDAGPDGIFIHNYWQPEPTPTPTPLPERDIDFFRLENLIDRLPETGFSADSE